jgi:plastocyanin
MRLTYAVVLMLVLLAVGACGASTTPTSTPAVTSPSPNQGSSGSGVGIATPSAQTVQITIGTDTGTELKFDPAEVTVQAGVNVQVTFENRASVPHNLTFQAPINVATSMVVAPGTTETVQFTAPPTGQYRFACTLHPGMGGTLVVSGG